MRWPRQCQPSISPPVAAVADDAFAPRCGGLSAVPSRGVVDLGSPSGGVSAACGGDRSEFSRRSEKRAAVSFQHSARRTGKMCPSYETPAGDDSQSHTRQSCGQPTAQKVRECDESSVEPVRRGCCPEIDSIDVFLSSGTVSRSIVLRDS